MKFLLGAFALVLPALASAQYLTAEDLTRQINADSDRRMEQVRTDMQTRQQEYWAQDRHQEQLEVIRSLDTPDYSPSSDLPTYEW